MQQPWPSWDWEEEELLDLVVPLQVKPVGFSKRLHGALSGGNTAPFRKRLAWPKTTPCGKQGSKEVVGEGSNHTAVSRS